MFLAEWKKILRQRWFLALTLVLWILNMALFLYQQKSAHADWLAGVSWYQQYQKKAEKMQPEEAMQWLLEEMNHLGNFQSIALVMDGQLDKEFLEILEMENPGILEEFKKKNLSEEELLGRLNAAGNVWSQMEAIRTYPDFLASIKNNYETMLNNDFYKDRPYAKVLGEKTVKDYEAMKSRRLKADMEYGVEALLENRAADLLLVILAACVCALTIMPEKSRDLFGLMKSLRKGRQKLIFIKLLTVAEAMVLLCVLFYGSLFVLSGWLYGFGDLNRSMQSVGVLRESCRVLSVGGFLLDTYFRTTFGIIALAWFMEFLFVLIGSSTAAMGLLAAAGAVFAGLNGLIAPYASMAWLHFLNPVQWFNRLEEYGSYQTVSIVGRPVNTLVVNEGLMACLFWVAFAESLYVFCVHTVRENVKGNRLIQKMAERFADHRPYSGRMVIQEWGKQLFKNRLFGILLLAGCFLFLSVEEHPITRGQKEQAYRSYIDAYGGPMTEETIDALKQEEKRLHDLEKELSAIGKRYAEGNISEEQYRAADMVIQNQLELLEPLYRVMKQAEELLAYEKKTGVQLVLTDELLGKYLLEQRTFDQQQGILVMFFVVVLLSGVFTGEQKNGMLNLLRASKFGMGQLFASKMLFGMLLSALVSAGMTAARVVSAGILYEIPDFGMPVQSFAAARELPGRMSLFQFSILTGGCGILGCCCLGALFLALSLWMKNQLYGILMGFAVFVLPLVLGGVGVGFPWEYTGNRSFFFLYQTALDGFWRQAVYLLAAMLTAGVSVFLAWRKYQNRQRRSGV